MVGKGGRKEEGRAKKGKERVTQICLAGSADDWDLDFLRLNFHSKRVKHKFDTSSIKGTKLATTTKFTTRSYILHYCNFLAH